MLDAAVLLDLSVSAVVICEQKSFRRNDFASAAAAEKNHGILE